MAVAISPQALSILVAVLVVLFTAVLIYFWRQRRGAKSGILMVGLNDSGKTLMFSRIVHDQYVKTFTSVKENVGDLVCTKRTLKMVDIPGHERVRGKFFDQYKSNARGIFFMVDASSLQKDIRDVAEYLYSLLTDPVVYSSSPMFAVVCNKQDQTMAKSSSVVKKLLEQEINTLRKTKGNRLASLNENEKQITIGKEGVDFKFEDLDSIQVDFIESSLTGTEEDDADISQVEDWLEQVAA